ncbi:stAR-related lipid transfer protein 13 [Aplochiton taeniatus]
MTLDGQDYFLRLGDTPRRRSALRLSRIVARQQLLRRLGQEIEAKEACDWLIAAGFPQYAQLYEEGQFPVDIPSVKRDHDFLERDLVEPLCRRLHTLNRCASMKMDVSQPKKKGEEPEEEQLAISNRWTYEWSSKRWSRLQDFLLDGANESSPLGSSESVQTDLSEPEITEESSLHSQDSDWLSMASLAPAYRAPGDLSHYNSLPIKSCRHGQGGRSRAKDFLRRMDMMRTWGLSSKRKGSSSRRSPLDISGPVLQGEEPVALQVLHCTPIDQLQSMPHEAVHQSCASPPPECYGNGCDSQSDRSVKAGACKLSRYLENMHMPSHNPLGRSQSYQNLLIAVPKDHKPGTFPKALSIESLAPPSRTLSPACPAAPRASRVSVYDNVPGSHLYASTGDLLDPEEQLFPHLDDIVTHVSGLQQIVDQWSRSLLPQGGEGERHGPPLDDTDSTETGRERRDSGVGASLTRPRLRWPSFRISLSQSASSLLISSQSAGQLSLLQKFSLLRLTAIMEKYSMSNKHGWTWSVPKFMKRVKVPDYRERSVFGVPLLLHVQRCGQPLPLCLQQALAHLRTQCLDQVGLFRKSGVKSRIQALRQQCDLTPDLVTLEEQSAYDVADLVKQFFRDLPEPLLTSRLGDTFLQIYQYVPKEQRTQAVRAAILLMADENREVLQTLLYFLRDVTSYVEENQMTAMNLAVCLGPSLFHVNILKSEMLSPRSIQRKYACGRPDQKDLSENLAATQGLAHMITECHALFQVPEEMVAQSRSSYMEAELLAPLLDGLGKTHGEEEEEAEEEEESSYRTYIEGMVQSLLKEAKDQSKTWMSRSTVDHTELASKQVGDGNPLRRWRVCVEVLAPPTEVLQRLLRERPLWMTGVVQERVLETLDQHTEVYQYCCQSMAPHPDTDYTVLRSWRSDLSQGWTALVCVSVDHEVSPARGSVRAVVLEDQYLLEPTTTNRTRLTHVCRVDLRGKSPEWYQRAYGHLCVSEVQMIRSSFQTPDPSSQDTRT